MAVQGIVFKCGNCGAVKRPHFVCPKCGYYKDEEIIVVES